TFDLLSSVWNGWINKIWGTSSSNLYLVGNQGAIAHYNGSSWRRLESGTDVHIKDIYGGFDPIKNELEILCIASNGPEIPQGRELLGIQQGAVTNLTASELPMDMNGIWFIVNRSYYIVGDGIYKKHGLNTSVLWQRLNGDITRNYIEAIRGTNLNDIFLSGHFGELLHFNGWSWKSYRTEISTYSTIYRAIAQRSDLVIAVGDQGERAVVARGYRR
ncbi:MAG: hypothetical protein QME52_14260, partial [Bacteroidota bacterium]|nr:hypothetical protein [Bacteroidota bacterium]